MLKTFTVLDVSHQTNSDTEGTIVFHVQDENGVTRSISAISHLDSKGNPKAVVAINKREVPLVESLFRTKINDSVDIEFDSYNKIYDRDLNKTINEKALEIVQQMEKERKFSYRIKHWFGLNQEAKTKLQVNLGNSEHS